MQVQAVIAAFLIFGILILLPPFLDSVREENTPTEEEKEEKVKAKKERAYRMSEVRSKANRALRSVNLRTSRHRNEAYDELKNLNLIFKTAVDLVAFNGGEEKHNQEYFKILKMYLGSLSYPISPDATISREDWCDATELAMLLTNGPEITSSKASWSGKIAPLYGVIYSIVWLYKTDKLPLDAYAWAQEDSAAKSELVKLTEELTALKSRLAEVERREEDNEKTRLELVKKERELNVQISSVENEYQDKLDEKDEEIERLNKLITSLRSKQPETTTEEDIEYLPLPDEGVFVMSCRDNILSRLKQEYPNWTYANAENIRKMKLGAGTRCAFIFHEHTSHKSVYSLRANSPGVPFFYVQGDNIDIILDSMRQQFTKYMREG